MRHISNCPNDSNDKAKEENPTTPNIGGLANLPHLERTQDYI